MIDARFLDKWKTLADMSIWHGHLSGGQVETFPFLSLSQSHQQVAFEILKLPVLRSKVMGHWAIPEFIYAGFLITKSDQQAKFLSLKVEYLEKGMY